MLPLLRRRRASALALSIVTVAALGFVAGVGDGLASSSLAALALVVVGATAARGLEGALIVGAAALSCVSSLYLLAAGDPARARALWATQTGVLLATALIAGATVDGLRRALRRAEALAAALREALVRRERELRRRAEIEVELRAATMAAERANAAKSEFLASMSHELRTPLNAIIGYSELLIEEFEDAQQQLAASADLNRIRSSGRHLLALINDILDLAKIEAGRMKLVRERFDLSELINELAGFVIPAADQRGNMLVVDIDESLGRVYGDPMRVRQIVLNLLSNAIKFTEDGMVILRARAASRGGGRHLEIAVTDTGIGISDAQLSRLFQPFVQAEDGTARRFGGTGLGLVLCARFVEMMDGSIEVESAPGEGSTFTVTLPARLIPAGVDARARERVEAARAHPDAAVLCLDDDPESLERLCHALESASLYPMPGPRVAEGLAFAREHKPAAAVIDVDGERGWETLADLLARGIPTVIVSAGDEEARGRELGALVHVRKPLAAGALLGALELALAGRRGDADAR